LCPAENTGPSAAITTASVSEAPASASAAVRSVIIAAESALRFSGRARVIVVVESSRVTRTLSLMGRFLAVSWAG
jgi:hypothetical protein